MTSIELEEIDSQSQLVDTVETVFADPKAREGMGWGPEDDVDEAMEHILGLWRDRFESGWHLYRVSLEDGLAGFTGFGPAQPDETWFAIYLLQRGQGLGSQVTERVLETAREETEHPLVAVTREENHACRGLLTSHGFTLQGEAPYDWAQKSALTWLVYRREPSP